MYEGMSRYAAKVLKRATQNISDNTDPQTLVELANTVVIMCKDKVLTETQVEAIGDGLDIDVPEWEPETTEDGLTLQDVADGLIDLASTVDAIINPQEEE